jgi:hypothetical protein
LGGEDHLIRWVVEFLGKWDTVVKVLNEKQGKVLHKVILHSATQMAADRNILKLKQKRNVSKLGNCVQD